MTLAKIWSSTDAFSSLRKDSVCYQKGYFFALADGSDCVNLILLPDVGGFILSLVLTGLAQLSFFSILLCELRWISQITD